MGADLGSQFRFEMDGARKERRNPVTPCFATTHPEMHELASVLSLRGLFRHRVQLFLNFLEGIL